MQELSWHAALLLAHEEAALPGRLLRASVYRVVDLLLRGPLRGFSRLWCGFWFGDPLGHREEDSVLAFGLSVETLEFLSEKGTPNRCNYLAKRRLFVTTIDYKCLLIW